VNGNKVIDNECKNKLSIYQPMTSL